MVSFAGRKAVATAIRGKVGCQVAVNKFLLRSAVTGALSELLFGFDAAVIAGTTYALRRQFVRAFLVICRSGMPDPRGARAR